MHTIEVPNPLMHKERYRDFAAEYGYEGKRFNLIIPARSWDDARARLKAIGMGQVIGSDVVSIPAPGAGLIYKIIQWFRSHGP
jgi:hypothetical protein